MHRLLFSFFFIAIYLCCSNEMAAQQRFKAGAIFGLNASQIQLDDVGGYKRLGLQGGLRAITILSEKSDLIFELLYSERGSRESNGSPTCFNGGALNISTKYVEVPVLITFKDWMEEDFYKIQVSGGFSFSRLLSASSEGSCHDDLTDLFKDNDFGVTLGAEYFTNRHLSFGMRWSRSITLLYKREYGLPDRNENSLRGFFLSFRGAYIF